MQSSEPSREGSGAGDLALRDARCRVLACLVPPLVHRLNNHLMVVGGTIEMASARYDAARVAVARQEALRLHELLGVLSSFAREQAPARVRFDLSTLVHGLEGLLRPFAETCGVELDVRSRLSAALVEGEGPRLEQTLATELGATLLARPAAGRERGGRPARLRLTLSGESGRIRLSWAYAGPPPVAQELFTAALTELATSTDAGLVRRALGGARAARLLFRGGTATTAAPVPGPDGREEPRPNGRRILLVTPARELGELLELVLPEAGHRVRTAGSPGAALALLPEGPDLVLVDTELGRETSGLLAELERRAPGTRIALLEARPGSAPPGLPRIEKPIRPDELLAFVRGVLA